VSDLVTRSAEIANEADQILANERAQDELTRFHDASQRLAATTSMIEALTALLGAMREDGISPAGFPVLRDEVGSVIRAVEQQEWADLDPVALDQAVVERAASVAGLDARARVEVQRAKDEWVARQPSVGQSVLRALRPIAPTVVAAAQRAVDDAQRAAVEDVDAVEDVHALSAAQHRLRELINQLFAEVALPTAVREFLEHVGTRGFPLSQMPDEVLDWLRDNNAAESFVVTLR
jgi:cell fate (sporulation/competence/biofilm development) regulator YlbF (YheA/YmcA/DUF963 family)